MEVKPKDDHVEKIKDVVTIDIEHELSDDEIKEIAMQLAQLYGEIEQAEERKKNVAAQHKNTIDGLRNQAKTFSSHITTGFRTEPRVAELFLDYGVQKRMYYDKRTGDFLIEKPFLEDDYQKKINFFAKQEQIEYNNHIGDIAEGGSDLPPEENANDALAKVINDKAKGKTTKAGKEGAIIGALLEKPTPKDNLGPNYGKSHEFADELLPAVEPPPGFTPPLPPEDALPPEEPVMGNDRNGNLTDIAKDIVAPADDLFAKAPDVESLPPGEK